MSAYLMIQNPGVAAEESFTLLGASTKRSSSNLATIGRFGTGNKMGIATCLRNGLNPIIFAGSLKLEFGTRNQNVNDGLKDNSFNRVYVKFGGKDKNGTNRSSTEDLGFVLEHGATDWQSTDMALREFISNALDRAVEEGEYQFIQRQISLRDIHERDLFIDQMQIQGTPEFEEMKADVIAYRNTATDYKNVLIEVVNDNQIRAKNGFTRIFVPLTEEVLKFFNNIGKWFLHFSEPENLNKTILSKTDRNIGDSKTAVIYRRGVRVREFTSSNIQSLFDYNLENLKLDESRNVEDWSVQHAASQALASADVDTLADLWRSLLSDESYWEHAFDHYGLEDGSHKSEQKERWLNAFQQVAGKTGLLATKDGSKIAERKGMKVVIAPESFVRAAERHGVRTTNTAFTDDDREGREIFDSTPDALSAVEFAWSLLEKKANGKKMPEVKTFKKLSGEPQLGYYKNGVIYINQDIAGNGSLSLGWHGLTNQLLVTALEAAIAYVVESDNLYSRDFRNLTLDLVAELAKEKSGI